MENTNNNQNRKVYFKRRNVENQPAGLAVSPYEGESFDSMLRRFKRLVDNSGVLKEFRERQSYESPSQARNTKRRNAQKRRMKAQRMYDNH